MAALDESRGIEHVANMPTEEVFTAPDARRVDGTVRASYPLQLQGTIVRGLEVRFEGGRAVEVRADEGEELMRAHIASDDGAARLGEVALVDGTRGSARPGSSSSTRSSTRTPPRTSPSARRSSRRSTGASELSARSATSAASTTRRSTPTS